MRWDDEIEINVLSDRLPDFMLEQAWLGTSANATTGASMKLDFAELERRVLLMCEEAVPTPDVRIQTIDILPEENSKGQPLFLDGKVMRDGGWCGIWGDILCHPNTLELLMKTSVR